MAYIAQKKERGDFQRLTDMMKPEATPTKRTGTEAPVGSQQAGTKGGQTAEQFTKTQGSPGGAFKRQLAGADIGAITRVAEQPLLREAGEEARRVASEGAEYRSRQSEERKKIPQVSFETGPVSKVGKTGISLPKKSEGAQLIDKSFSGDTASQELANRILTGATPDVPEFTTTDIKEFTPMQALRGDSIEGLLQKEARGPYTTGMAGLDALLFKKKGGVGQLAARGQAIRATEQAAADKLERDLTSEARGEMRNLVETQKTKLKEGLGSKARETIARLERNRGQTQKNVEAQNRAAMEQSIANASAKIIADMEASFGRPLTAQERANVQAGLNKRSNIMSSMGRNRTFFQDLFAPPTATLADVASAEDVSGLGYLTNLLKLSGEDVSGYGLGQKSTALTPKAVLTAEDFARAQSNFSDPTGAAFEELRMAGTQGLQDYWGGIKAPTFDDLPIAQRSEAERQPFARMPNTFDKVPGLKPYRRF